MTEHDLTAQDFGAVRTATYTHGDRTEDTDVRADRWTNYGHDRLYLNDLFTSTTDAYVDLETGEVVVDGTKTRTTDLDVEGDELVITIKRPSGTYEIRVEIESIDADESEDELSDDETDDSPRAIADGGRTTAERADDVDAEDYALSKREVAQLAQHGPQDTVGNLSQEAYDTVLDRWRGSDRLEQLEESECFDWASCYWEVGDPQGRGLEFEIITGVEWRAADDPRKEIADIAWQLVREWIDELYALVAGLQKKSNFGRQEFRAYWLGANLSKSEVAHALDVELPTRKGYWDRAQEGIGRADATKRLQYDHDSV